VRSSFGRAKTSAGGPLLDDPTIIHHHQPACNPAHEGHLVTDDNHG
jgi:hypothetical protein